MSYSLETVKVHIVEDNAANLTILIALVRDVVEIPHCIGSRSGQALFDYIAASPDQAPNVILLDLEMPREDGYQVLQRIREHPLLRSTLVIACTAHVSRSDIARAHRAGFDGFLGKPLDYDRLPGQMEHILAGQRVWDAGT